MDDDTRVKTLTYVIGGLIGLATGLAASYILLRNKEQNDGKMKLTSGDSAKIGFSIVSLLRMISESGTK